VKTKEVWDERQCLYILSQQFCFSLDWNTKKDNDYSQHTRVKDHMTQKCDVRIKRFDLAR
jgi:hypothetical protein